MKTWKGKWIIFVALGHAITALLFFGDVYQGIIGDGVFNAVTSAQTGLAVWFILFAMPLIVIGLLVIEIERRPELALPRSVTYCLAIMTMIGVILMPVSGFWLLLPPVIAMLIGTASREKT